MPYGARSSIGPPHRPTTGVGSGAAGRRARRAPPNRGAPMTALPDLAAMRAWCQVSDTAITDAQLQQVMDAEAVNQEKACRIPDPADRDPDLIQALFRRVARVLAARTIPTGLTDGDQGPQRLSAWDGEIQRLEGMDRKFTFG